MTLGTRSALARFVVIPALVFGSVARAQDGFRLLGEKEIRARLIGKDITDSSHWVTYFRPDGVLISDEMGRKWTGVWKIQKNRLCMSNSSSKSLDCNEVWMSGANVRMRVRKEEETFDAVVETHKANGS